MMKVSCADIMSAMKRYMPKDNRKKVAIIDYDAGNMFSVHHACKFVGLDPVITADAHEIMNSAAAILPGVGAFGDAMNGLKRLDLVMPIKEFVQSGKPFMGICLGMQLLFSESEEFGCHKGLNLIEGNVVKFPSENTNGLSYRVPQMGWNQIFRNGEYQIDWACTPLKDINEGEFMYFVHSYYVVPYNNNLVLSISRYNNISYCSSVGYRNVFATQFHPEKSAGKGLRIYKNWASTLRQSRES